MRHKITDYSVLNENNIYRCWSDCSYSKSELLSLIIKGRCMEDVFTAHIIFY